jgi:RNA polymerase sigma-70 factor (ECF subfamily)
LDTRFDSPEHLAWERACLARARGGDRAAFAELYRRFAQPLFARVLLPKLGNRQAAEDALAETFRTLLERIDRYEDQGTTMWFWLCRVAVNKALDMHRVKARTSRALVSFEDMLAPLRTNPDDTADAVEGRVEQAAARDTVGRVLVKINPRYRRAIELRFMEEKERQACADLMEVKLGTFDVLILRALRAFKKEWEIELGVSPTGGDDDEREAAT